ncbi:MAG: DUF3467 domain-containing protein [bacterium]|nr:DUF3467 domain-containing protein [bacterium]
MAESSKSMNIKITDEELKGRYSNLVRISHTREEFILDFINMVPPQGAVTARIITSPGHLKRLIRALGSNVKLYEQNFGAIQEAAEPSESGGQVN